MARVANVLPYLSIRFVDSEWLSLSELGATLLCWVVDVELPINCLPQISQRGLPLLVPAERDDLKDAWRSYDHHYSYGTAAQAAERILEILRDQTTVDFQERKMLATRQATAGDR